MQSRSKVNRRILCKNVSMLAVAFSAVLAAHGQGQPLVPSPQVTAPTFDVVSIKPDKSGSGGMSITGVTDSFKGTNLSLTMLLINCYPVRDDLISGLPGWARAARFDVNAKIVNPDKEQIDKLTPEQRKGMLLVILKDRFHLQAHLETRILPVYDLIIARGGPKFTGAHAAETDTATEIAKKNLMAGGMLVNDGELTADAMPVSSLAYSLAGEVGRTVIDKTALPGTYNFELKWKPDRDGPANADNGQAESQNSTSSIFTALEEQLGLKLQPSKGPVQTLVVDHVEMPSEN